MAGDKTADYTPVSNVAMEEVTEEAPGQSPQLSAEENSPVEQRAREHEEREDAEDAPFIDRRKSQDEDEDEDEDLEDPLDPEEGMVAYMDEKEETKSTLYLFLLTLSIYGLQIAWSTELGNGSPYLLSLGIDKSVLSFVWIAGPLMGVLVQPYVGILSDRSRSKWGKRRPFMVVGAISTSISFIALAWAQEIVQGILGIFGASPEAQGAKVCVIVWAVLWVYILDFAINAVQAAIRAFIVDNAPTHQQEDANAWAGRHMGFGSIVGYLSGYFKLPRYIPIFGDTEFKILSVLASLQLCLTVCISCMYIKERDPRLDGPPEDRGRTGVASFFKQTYWSMRRLPPQIRKVCEVQLFNWIGWFPFLFYITTYIGQLYVNPIFEEHPDLPPEKVDKAWEDGTRYGSFAFFINSIVAFAGSILLPILVVPSYGGDAVQESMAMTGRNVNRFSRTIASMRIPRFTLRRAWLLSHLFFAACMLCTFFAFTTTGGIVIVAMLGVPWAITSWAPFALISAEVSKRATRKRAKQRRQNAPPAGRSSYVPPETDGQGEEDQAGVVLGLHNVSISAPQIVATLISSGIFRLLQRDRGVAGDESVAWVLRFGGVVALIAAFMTWRLKEESEVEKEGAAAM